MKVKSVSYGRDPTKEQIEAAREIIAFDEATKASKAKAPR